MRNDLKSSSKPSNPIKFNAKTIFFGIILLILLYVLGSLFYSAFIQSDEDKIREAIHAAADGARARSPKETTAILAESFKGPMGISGDEVHKAVVYVLMQVYKKVRVKITPEPIPVELDPNNANKATATFRAEVEGDIGTGKWTSLNAQAGGSEFVCTFRKTEKGWKIEGLELKP